MTGMDDLATWLRARLDEEERVALAAQAEQCDVFDGTGIVVMHSATGTRSVTLTSTVATYLARWDPARALALIARDRRILDQHQPVHEFDPTGPVCSTCGEQGNPGDETAVARWPCLTVRLLTLPYADRPEYREEWRP